MFPIKTFTEIFCSQFQLLRGILFFFFLYFFFSSSSSSLFLLKLFDTISYCFFKSGSSNLTIYKFTELIYFYPVMIRTKWKNNISKVYFVTWTLFFLYNLKWKILRIVFQEINLFKWWENKYQKINVIF